MAFTGLKQNQVLQEKKTSGIIIAQYFEDTKSISEYGCYYRFDNDEYEVISRIDEPN